MGALAAAARVVLPRKARSREVVLAERKLLPQDLPVEVLAAEVVVVLTAWLFTVVLGVVTNF